MFDEKFISFNGASGQLSLVGVPIVVDRADFPGIQIAARNLAGDFGRVTKGAASPLRFVADENDAFKDEAETAIIVGSIEASPMIKSLAKSGKLDCSNTRGKWESYMTVVVDNPFNGCCRALVIVGSDKRGAIFGMYALSEQIGVSPYGSFLQISILHLECKLILIQVVLVG